VKHAGTRATVLVAHPSADLYGSDRMTLETVAALAARDVDVVVTLPVDGPLAGEVRRQGARVVVRRAPVLRKQAMTPRGFLALVATALASLPGAVRLLREVRPGTVYVATVTLPLWLLLARCLGLRAVCHVHEAERAVPRLVRRLLAAPLRCAHEVVVNSDVSRAVVGEDCPAVAPRVRVVRNGLAAPPTTVAPRAELTDPVRLVFVGRLSARKGADLAVDAVARLAELGVPARLEIVGDAVPGAPEYHDALRSRIEAAGLGDLVTFTGFVPDVWPHLQAADVVLVPSRGNESFGNAAAEAVLAARPVLVADVAGLRAAVRPYAGARVVAAADPQVWAAAVLDVRARWATLRAQVQRDAEAAARDLAPERYRREIADVLRGAAPVAPVVEDLRLVVAVLTYRRPYDLTEVLPLLAAQAASCRARADVLVVDNDPDAGAADVVQAAGAPGVRYVHEPEPGIAAARNRALAESAHADLLVFVDDDERPTGDWLDRLLATYERTGAAGVVGPVVSEFVGTPHPWVAAGRFFDRRRLPTGTPVDVAATNNLLLDLHQVRAASATFDPRYGLSGGSDSLFTLSLTRSGRRLVWCDEAVVVDRVPAERSTPRWVLARAFRTGNGWSRVSLELTTSPLAGVATRVRLAGAGAVRLAGGSARWVAGALLRRIDLRARGARTAARGAGLVAGAIGFVYAEYRRRA
jgi:glycosyltransferase involved in cell wall biosynthesis